MENKIYMVRHCESPFVFGQEKSRGLSDQGFEDEKIAELLDDMDIHYIASSSYTRAVQTVQSLAARKNLTIVEFDDLRERPINQAQ